MLTGCLTHQGPRHRIHLLDLAQKAHALQAHASVVALLIPLLLFCDRQSTGSTRSASSSYLYAIATTGTMTAMEADRAVADHDMDE
jgi:hypothetical protein